MPRPSQRLRDGLAGAAIAVVVLLLALAVLAWTVTRPAGDGPPAAGGPPPPAVPGPSATPPRDLDDDETWLGDVALDAGTVVAAGTPLRDVRAEGRDVRAGPAGVVAGRLRVEATVPFDVVADRLGPGTVVRAAGRSRATVERTVRVAGRELGVVATGAVRVERGRLVVEPRSVDVGGPDVLADALGAVARRFVTIEHRVEGLPPGLVLRDVTVRDDGFRASLDGADVRWQP